jgi:ABC-type nickel/cobalt efflux system permease component RcnA
MFHKKILFLFFIILTLPFYNTSAHHGLESSITHINIGRDYQGEKVEKSKAFINIDLNWIQLTDVFNEEGFDRFSMKSTIERNDSRIKSYLLSNLLFYNEEKSCFITLESPEIIREETFISPTIAYRGLISCPSEISSGYVLNTLFNNIPQQENNLYIFKENRFLAGAVLTRNFTKVEYNVDIEGEEPMLKESHKGFSALLETFSKNLKENTFISFLIVFLLAFIVGVLHTFEGGHSKILLASIIIDKKINFKKSLSYVSIFTLSHMSDIFIFGGILLIFGRVVNLYSRLSFLQTFAYYAMFFLAVIMLFKALSEILKKKLLKKESHHHHHHKSTKNELLMAFLIGLNPCLMGWAVFMLIVSTKQLWLIFPVMIAFALGIFSVLITFAWVINRFKDAVYKKLDFLGIIAPLVSSLIIIIVSLSLILN